MADTSSDVAGFISDKTATAIQQTWVNGKWINLGDTNQRNNMQVALNKVGKQVEEQQVGIADAQDVASAAMSSASAAIESSKVNSQAIADNSSAVNEAKADAANAFDQAKSAMSVATSNSSALKSQSAVIDSTTSEVALKADQTAVDTLKDTVTANSAAISVQANEIKQKVTSSDVQGLLNNGGYATQTWTSDQIDLTSNKFSLNLSALQTQVDNSAVGTNLLTGTSGEYKTVPDSATIYVGGLVYTLSSTDVANIGGQTITIRTYIKNTTAIPVALKLWFNKQFFSGNNVDANSEGYSTITATLPLTSSVASDISIRGNGATSGVQYKEFKLEKGSVATDWCPNPADNASVTSVTNLEAAVDGLQTTVSNKVNTTDYNSKMTQLSNLIDGKVSTADYNAEVAILANDIDLKVAKGNVVSQINQEAGGNTLIQVASGKGKLYLDTDSTIFSGNAFIPGAYITDLNVDKLNAGTMTGVNSNIGNTYTSLLDSLTRYNVTLDTDGMQTGDVYASDLDYTDYVTVGSLNKSTTNTANTSTTATKDVTSPTLFTIDGSKLSNGDRVLVKLDINYFYDWTYLGTQIVLQSATGSHVSFSQQALDYGYYTYSFVITWSAALGTSKVPFQIKAIGLPPDSNLYAVGANFYTDHGTGTANYYEAGGALKADGSLHLKDYYSGTASKITDEQYHGYQWDRGTMRLYKYTLEQDNTQTTPVTTITNYETQMDGAGLRFMGNSTGPVLEFFGADVNSLIDSLGQEPWGIDYTGARNLATGIYFDQFGNIHGYSSSAYWSLNGVDQGMVAQFPLNNKNDITLNPPSGYGLRVNGTITTPSNVNAALFNGFTMTTNNIKAASGSGFYLDNAGGKGGNADLHVKSVTQSSLLSLKTNISEIDSGTALNLINQTEIYDYQFKDDVTNRVTKHYASYIIDDVNDTPQYKEPEEFLSNDKKGRDDGSLLSYAVLAIQELSKQVDTLKQQLAAK